MPIDYVRRLTAAERTRETNLHLGVGLAFVAGATNAGAFLAVGIYTSHMTGVVSEMADALVLGNVVLVLLGLTALLSFVAGSATTSLMVNYSRRRGWSSAFALPLALEAVLLLFFGIMGAWLRNVHSAVIPATTVLLCFTMGIQNAVITKISNSEIRTTHVTGIVTDLGIELGKLLYWNLRADDSDPIRADRSRLRVLSSLLLAFFAGGVLGAFGFKTVGFVTTLPLAALLIILAAIPAFDDLRSALR